MLWSLCCLHYFIIEGPGLASRVFVMWPCSATMNLKLGAMIMASLGPYVVMLCHYVKIQ